MNNKLLISGVLGLGTCMIYTPIHAGEAQAQSKPNVLIIYTDDMGAGDVSFLNNGWVKTPNIDKLASGGLIVTNYYSSSPVSSPSRVGLTTGRFPTEMGINCYLQTRKGNAACEQFDYLDASVPTMAKVMKSAGYTTGHFGKWHMGGGRDVIDAPQITEYGFDEYISTWESPNPDPVITDSAWIWSRTDQVKRWDRTAYFVDKTLDFLKRHKGEPCFVNLWPDDMHTPWVPSQKTMDSERTSWTTPPNFKEVLTEYDKQIGRLMEGLTKLGLEKNTIVVFTSDNGPAPSFQQMRTNSLLGVKCSLYEGGIRMPFAIHWPEKIKAGGINDSSIVCAVDLLPSLCALTGAKLPLDMELSGEDMSRALLGEPQIRKKDLMWDFGRNKAFNYPRGKNAKQKSPHLAIRRGSMKLLVDSWDENFELYDLVADPKETTNIAEQNPDLVKELHIVLMEWWAKRKIPAK